MNENEIDALSSIIHPCKPLCWSNFWQGVAEATHHLITSNDYATAINQALATLGKLAGADRVYIFEIYPHPETGIRESSLRFEWVRETVSTVENLQLRQPIHPIHSMSQWCKTLFSGHSISGPVRELPDALQQILAPQRILSILIIPMSVNDQLWGLIGFEDRHTERQWSKDEQAILTTMALYIGATLSKLNNESGEIFTGMAMSPDLTESKQAQEALRKSEAENRALLNAIPDLLLRIAQDGTYLSVRGEKDRDFLMPPSQMVGKKVYEVLPKEVAAQGMHYVQQALSTGKIQIFEHQLLNHGEMRDYEVRITKSGEAEVLMIIRDITERKQGEIQQRLFAQRARWLAEMPERIRCSLNLEQILNTTVTQVRQFLQADRVYICPIDGAEPGRIVAESVGANWLPLIGKRATHVEQLRKTWKLFESSQVNVFDELAQTVGSPKIADNYTEAQVKTLLVVPIFVEEELFGLLVAEQCSHPRRWQPIEIDLLQAFSTQLSIAIHQSLLSQELAKLNTNLEQQIEERTQELQQKIQEIQELNQLKDVFLHAVTHEMRTPFMGWSMALRNLLNNQETNISVSRSILERMVQSSDRQLHLINLLLEIHSIEVENLLLEPEPVQLSQLIDAVAEDLKPLFVKNQATLTNLMTDAFPIVNADPRQLRRVLENLLTYTLEHNPPGLNLTLGATKIRKMMRFTLHYDGVGMSEETCEHLFKLYAPSCHTRRLTVSRLGLYFCWQIIAAHGGKIGATTTQEARPSFWFTLPL